MPNMMNSILSGESSKLTAHSSKPALAPEKASKALKVADPNIMRKAITVTRNAPAVESTMTLKLSDR